MNRSAAFALAAIIGWGAGLSAASAGNTESHSPRHKTERATVASRQIGTAPAERHIAKQTRNDTRHSSRADRVGTLRQVWIAPVDRHKAKQGSNHARSMINADKAGTKHAYRSRLADRNVSKQTIHHARQTSHAARIETKHRSQLASRRYHSLKRGVKGSHFAAKKSPLGDKQPHRRAVSRKS